jgi:oxygen-independent coproporphyrinogen-3 oxidase
VGAPPDPAYGIYAHIPFCARRCDYCDFFVTIGVEPGAIDFFADLAQDLALSVRSAGAMRPPADTLYLGGGTPSLVEPAAIARFVSACRAAVDLAGDAEVTLEANPETVTPERAAAWREAGVTRLSLGVQSFDDAVLRPRGRSYTGDEAVATFAVARRAGFGNLGIDLIAGLPEETRASFARGLSRLLSLAPEHVSVYLLETEESLKLTPLSRALREGRASPAAEDEVIGMYDDARRMLTGAGYEHYEIANFCRPGFASRHNLKYWLSHPWFAAGPSACSYVGGRRGARPADLAAWRDAVRMAAPPIDQSPADPEAAAREALILNLRLTAGVGRDEFRACWGYDPAAILHDALSATGLESLVHDAGGRVMLTDRGRLLSNEIFARLI